MVPALRCYTLALAAAVAAAEPLLPAFLAAPFGSFDERGTRKIDGWRAEGSTHVDMGAVRLTNPQQWQTGALWLESPVKLGDSFSFQSKFRMSGTQAQEGGGTMAWGLLDHATVGEGSDFFGLPNKFQGLALVLSTEHPDTIGDLKHDAQKIALYANNGGAEPTELGSCLRAVYYDESRDDFSPAHLSSLRLSYDAGRAVVEIDPRNTQSWQRCVTSTRTSAVIPNASDAWRRAARVGVAAVTGERASRFELSAFGLYGAAAEAAAAALPDMAGPQDRALSIAHQLEHGIYGVQRGIDAMLDGLAQRTARDEWRIVELEQRLSDSALDLMEARLAELEERMSALSQPLLDSRVRQVEARAQYRLRAFERETAAAAHAWARPFLVIFGLLAVFAWYTHREYAYMNKWNSNYM